MELREGHVEVAVTVDVRIGRAATNDRLEQIRPGFRAIHSGKTAHRRCAAAIPEQLRRLRVRLAFLHLGNLLLEMAVGRQQVEPAVEIVVKKEQPKLQQQPAVRPDALSDRVVGKQKLIVWCGDIQRGHFIGEVADADSQRVVVPEPRHVDPHRAAYLAVVVEPDAADATHLGKRAVLLVFENEVVNRVVGHDEIHPAVPIEIHRRHSERLGHRHLRGARANLHTGSSGDVGEPAVAVVSE